MIKPRIIQLFFLGFFVNIRLFSQITGCTDPLATNFNSVATQNDGSCLYTAVSVSPIFTYPLTDSLKETSGLIRWGDHLYSHNDDTDKQIYKLDTTGVKIVTYSLNLVNKDWEEISQDASYIYLGDFGNNMGNRIDLRIYRISKSSLLANAPVTDTIKFSYSNQQNFAPAPNTTDFDCEAFIVSQDSIYLFTKQWTSNSSGIYSLAKVPGTYTASLRGTLPCQGLITGATYLESERLIALSGYNNFLQPFVYLLYDFAGKEFASGNKRKLGVSLPFTQIEGVCTHDGRTYFVSNEYFSNPPVATPQKLFVLNLDEYVSSYLDGNVTSVREDYPEREPVSVYPNPFWETLNISAKESTGYEIWDATGQLKQKGECRGQISTKGLAPGLYVLRLGFRSGQKTFKLIKE